MYHVEPIIYRRAQKGQVPLIDTQDGNYLSHLLYEAGKREGMPKVSIGVLGYRHIDDTKRCVESILRFVGDVDYELILLDNGSQDNNETLDYFQSVPTMRKKIIQVEEPLGRTYGIFIGLRLMYEYADGDIFVYMANDHIMAENTLQNMIACLDSSPDIGMVTPMSSNVWMLQDPGLQYSNFDEMFAAAKEFNRRSDPRKWQERIEVSMVMSAMKREVLTQCGFFGFGAGESDLCQRIQQAGYKVLLLGDTWSCHNHDYRAKESHGWIDNTETGKKTLENLQRLSTAKVGGLEQFGERMVFEHKLISLLEKPITKTPKILAINVTAGQPLMDVRNKLREYSIFNSKSTAFCTNCKYYTYLSTAADQVYCDRIQFLSEDLEGQRFDIIILGEYINLFPDPGHLMKTLMNLLKPNGQLLFKLKNSVDTRVFWSVLGNPVPAESKKMIVLTLEDIKNLAEKYGACNLKVSQVLGNYPPETIKTVGEILANTKAVKDVQAALQNILTTEYLFCVQVSLKNNDLGKKKNIRK